MSILVFDSGIGGLTILREVRVALPGRRIVYVGDDAGFPYGEWDEEQLIPRIVDLFERCVEAYTPELAIVACNTASTLIMPALRARFDIPIVGTIPPIKPAANQTASGLVSVLATPGTVKRPMVQKLVADYSGDADITLIGSTGLARLAEEHMQGLTIDQEKLSAELAPCFIEREGKRTDIVVLGCAHYPFLVHEMRRLAPWPVDWIEPAEAIARRVLSLIGPTPPVDPRENMSDIAMMTAGSPPPALARLLIGFGLLPADRPFRPLV
jgi:glutamate racemase